MGNAVPKPTCNVVYKNNQGGCNSEEICYYVNKSCRDKVEFYKLSDIPISDIKCSIYPDTTKSNNYLLYCINRNNARNIVIKSIQITNCNSLYRSDCNILIPLNIENNEFALKPFLQTFNIVDGELTRRINLTLAQVNLIRKNNNQITIIDIYDVMIVVTVELYDVHFEEVVQRDQGMIDLNVANINKTAVNLKTLGLTSKLI